ncbi:MAG TPA: tetraacyldisaccharide 4'-kinase, partial [bacterium]|nr:tetraacyldisaccharide 4'-kinase [bacterium]
MNFNQKVQKEWNRESRSLLGYALKAASFGYGLAVGLRTQTFASGIRETHTLPVPVVCVGNLVVGGVGKTPLVEPVARFYLEIGL